MDSKNGLMCLGPPCRLSGDRMIPCSDREISSEQGRKKVQRFSTDNWAKNIVKLII